MNRAHNEMRRILLTLLAVSLGGCIATNSIKHYDGSEKADDQLSEISNGYFVIITEIDDKAVGDTAFTGTTFDKQEQFNSYTVLPGIHTITYRNYDFGSTDNTYLVNAKTSKIEISTTKSHNYTVGALLDKDNPDKEWKIFVSERDANGNMIALEIPIKHL